MKKRMYVMLLALSMALSLGACGAAAGGQAYDAAAADENGQVDLRRLMEILGSQGLDSILLEGGGELNEAALRAGIVQEARVFIAPKIFGGSQAKTPVTGAGVLTPKEAKLFSLKGVSQVGEDLMLEYQVLKRCVK